MVKSTMLILQMVRARYGTGVYLKLNKRECNIKIRLTPCSSDFLKVQFKIDGVANDFFLSGVMGSQFSSLLTAVYCLYEEDDYQHWYFRRRNNELKREYPDSRKNGNYSTSAEIFWDGEAYGYTTINLWRESPTLGPMPPGQPDPVKITFWRRKGKAYTIDGRDLCYAVAKACTEALKKYGFKGFVKSNSGEYLGDSISIEKLLFIKAYALGAMDVRETREAWKIPNGWMEAEASSFEKEMELLLFDM